MGYEEKLWKERGEGMGGRRGWRSKQHKAKKNPDVLDRLVEDSLHFLLSHDPAAAAPVSCVPPSFFPSVSLLHLLNLFILSFRFPRSAFLSFTFDSHV